MRKTSTLMMVLLVTACGGSGSGTDDTAPPTRQPNDPVLMVTSEGGFVPVEFQLDQMPRYLVTVDRTLYSQGPIPLIFPGPLLPNVQVGSVDEATWEEIMMIVEEVGLPGIDEKIDNENAQMIADAATDFVTYYDDNGAHRYGVYALGLTESAGSADRILLGELIQMLDQAAANGESQSYLPERMQVAAGVWEMGGAEPGMTTVEPWPLAVDYADMEEWVAGWRCVTVEDEVAVDLFDIFSEANQATQWNTGREDVTIKARPLLPGETGCAPPAAA